LIRFPEQDGPELVGNVEYVGRRGPIRQFKIDDTLLEIEFQPIKVRKIPRPRGISLFTWFKALIVLVLATWVLFLVYSWGVGALP